MSERFHETRAAGIRVVVDLSAGHLRTLEIERDGRRLTPLYTAPWVDDPAIANDESIVPNLRALSGDFFCAPFGGTDEEGVPTHGWPANSPWEHLETFSHDRGGAVSRYALQRPVQGARLIKEVTLRDGHPFVYQRHVFAGGAGRISVASHAMTKFATRGRLSFSPKAYAETPRVPLESDPARGRHALAYPAALHRSRSCSARRRRHHRSPLLSDRRAARGFRHAGRGAGKRSSAGRRRSATMRRTSC